MRKKLDENEIVLRKWPPIFREGLRFTDHDLGIMDVMIQGEAEITAKDLKKMKKFGYIFDGMCIYTRVDKSLPAFFLFLVSTSLADLRDKCTKYMALVR